MVQDATHATPTLFNAGTRVQQCSSCFAAGTRVLMAASDGGGSKPIQKVRLGDVVMTHRGRARRVTQLHTNRLGRRDLLRLSVGAAGVGVTVTADHRFWAVRLVDGEASAPTWVAAGDLVPGAGYYVGVADTAESRRDAEPDALLLAGGAARFLPVRGNDPVAGGGDDTPVYTLGVEEDHSYAVRGGLLAENCFLLGTEDSLRGIYKTLADAAQISKWAGGIGLHVSNVRARGARIASSGGASDGLVPMLKVFNETARYCNQAGRRKGSIAVYLEPWHADVWEFVELRRSTGAETERCRDLFPALWVPDDFMRRLLADDWWYLMSPDACPGLIEAVGAEYSRLYAAYAAAGRYVRRLRARELWDHVLHCQLETGTPYVMFKDHVNRQSNLANLGVVRSGNLCAEVTQVSSASAHAVCNLASIAVNRFVVDGAVDHAGLHAAAAQLAVNLDRVIDLNAYPTPEARASNLAARPIGIGLQGLGDAYCLLGLAYGSEAALALDAAVAETVYHGALEASVGLAVERGAYPGFEGSPASRGLLQMDLYANGMLAWAREGGDPTTPWPAVRLSGRYDWDDMRARVARHGLRNSMLTALMPTATTSQILGSSESFDPLQSNVFKRTTLAGEFMVVNQHLQRALMAAGLWTEALRQRLLAADGSVAGLDEVPTALRAAYRTVWEVPLRSIVDHAAARAPFVSQAQSMSLHLAVPSFQRLSSALLHAWRCGLKTGLYYLRSRAAVEAPRVAPAPAPAPAAACLLAGPACGSCGA